MKLEVGLLLPFAMIASGAELPQLTLSRDVMELSTVAARLSSLAYTVNTTDFAVKDNDVIIGYEHPDYDEIHFFTEEPDQAIVAKKDNHCYAAFRGTNANYEDWSQNFDLSDADVFKKGTEESCQTRKGYYDGYFTAYVDEFETKLNACIESTCPGTGGECVSFTGHSQGGAIATVASVNFADLTSRRVITFGQPPAVDTPCPLIPSSRFYRYVNSVEEQRELEYDPVPYSPTLVSNSRHFGYLILLSYDETGVAYVGYDQENHWFPNPLDLEADAHSMGGTDYSYEYRCEQILGLTGQTFPVRTSGFEDGTYCDSNKLCASGICERETNFFSPRICKPSTDIVDDPEVDPEDDPEVPDDPDTIPEFNLTQNILELSTVAARLSNLAYTVNTTTFVDTDNEYEELFFFTDEPDQAIVAKKGNRCYAAFRGTNANVDDWSQNFDLSDADVFKKESGESCQTRKGYFDGYFTSYVDDLEEKLLTCIESTCPGTGGSCAVLTGHSQGGAIATVASVVLAELNLRVVTFGQPPAVDAPCPLIPSSRFYRYLNSVEEQRELEYDPIPYSPTLVSKSNHFGYFILLTYDETGVAYLGYDQKHDWFPNPLDLEVDAHSMGGTDYSYQYRLEQISALDGQAFPVRTSGFKDGTYCDSNKLCASGICERETGFFSPRICKAESSNGDGDGDGDTSAGTELSMALTVVFVSVVGILFNVQ